MFELLPAVRGIVQICCHCGSSASIGAKLCGYCNTAEKRRAADEEGTKILGREYKCAYCIREKLYKERLAQLRAEEKGLHYEPVI